MQRVESDSFGLIVIGDEILFGRRSDSHLEHFRHTLASRGLRLTRCWLLPDQTQTLVDHLRFSLRSGMPTFVCGGIGATPDDLTRPCAAQAAGVPLVRHPEATALIEARFGDAAYPTRIRMADLPRDCELIPNPHNQIPGFTLLQHHFLPGFPEMAWPMADWVLENLYAGGHDPLQEASLLVLETPESTLVPLMEDFADCFPDFKLYSLPHLGETPKIELGLRGRGDIASAMTALVKALEDAGIPHRDSCA
ncbi:MAG: molybdopterin-binding protein [Candidatus Thiodiazotropha sp.]